MERNKRTEQQQMFFGTSRKKQKAERCKHF